MIKIQKNGNSEELSLLNRKELQKPTNNIILSSERLNAFLLRSKTRQGCLLLPFFPNTMLEVLASTKGKKRKEKSYR
jgi:hypothetical protein